MASRAQLDLLDRVVDNVEARRREIYRNGTLIAHVSKNCLDAPLLAAFKATGEWGCFAAKPPQEHA
jgi:hypothetical protein